MLPPFPIPHEDLQTPHGNEVCYAPILCGPCLVCSLRLDQAQTLDGVISRFRTRRTDDGTIAIRVIGNWLAGGAEKSLVYFGGETPGRTAVVERLAGWEFKTDETAFGVQKFAHTLRPLRS